MTEEHVRPIEVPWSVLRDYHCFGCSPHNASGVQLTFEPHPEGVRTAFRLDRRYESYPGIVHGGMVGVICDETMGNLLVLRFRRSAFTVSMRMRYVAPLVVDVPYSCVARVRDGVSDGLFRASAEVLDGSGSVMATATAVYQPFALEDVRDQLSLGEADAALLAETVLTSAPQNGA